MKNSKDLQARKFQALVAKSLKIAPKSSEVAVREALRSKGPGYIEWYDTRLEAIAQAQLPPHNLRRAGSQVLGQVEQIRNKHS